MSDLSKSTSLLKEFYLQAFTDDPANWLKWIIVFAVFIFGFFIQLRLYKVFEPLWHGPDKKRKKAVERGNVLPAVLVHKYATNRRPRSESQRGSQYSMCNWRGKYEYEINGKKKYYWAYFVREMPPADITLYYVSNPKKLFCFEEYHYRNYLGIVFLPVVFLPFLMAALTAWLIGLKSGL